MVWEDNAEPVFFFTLAASQWRITAAGTYQGIDYPSLEAIFRLYQVDLDKRLEIFEDVQAMEFAALGVLNKDHEG